MTTVLWDHTAQILATDSRSTHVDRNSSDHADHTTTRRDDKTKIHLNFGPKAIYKDEQILAVAGAGSALTIGKNIRCLRHGQNLLEMHRAARSVGAVITAPCRLLVVTTGKVYTISINERSLQEQVELVSCGIGSGGGVAIYLNRHLKVPAALAVLAAGNVDDSTGGVASYVEFEMKDGVRSIKKGRKYKVKHYANERAVNRAVVRAVCNSN